ncbi:hypothetical protein [Halorientalis sp.]|uniref:hypothetical protein n=1 Tax=Halorientalis sp. TaxID=1931229 RepID=UPI0026355944|nr:hypothetical protein [Halorientalis sp.]
MTTLTEDAVALPGLLAALVGVAATRITGNTAYDAATAVVIGILLTVFAVALVIGNKRLVVGESLSADSSASYARPSSPMTALSISTTSGRCSPGLAGYSPLRT